MTHTRGTGAIVLTVVGACIVAIAVISKVCGDAPVPGDAASSTMSPEIGATNSADHEIAALKAKLAIAETELNRAREVVDSLRIAQSSSRDQVREEPSSAAQTFAGLASEKDVALAREDVDESWASTVHDDLAQFFDGLALPGSEVAAITCRTSMCRVDIAHSDEDAAGEFVQTFRPPEIASLSGETLMVESGAGGRLSGHTIYLTRAQPSLR